MIKRIISLLSLILFSTIIYGQTTIRLTQIEPIQGTVIKSQGEAASKVLTTNGLGGASWQPQPTTTPYMIAGTGTVAGTWIGADAGITGYYDGLTILYQIPVAGTTTTTLNINGFGAKTIYRSGASKLTTHYPVNAICMLIYSSTLNGGCFMTEGSDYDSNTFNQIYWGNAVTAGAAIYSYKILMQASDGKFYPLTLETGTGTTKTVSTESFMLNSPILYYATTTTIAVNGAVSNVYSEIPMTTLSYTANQASWTDRLPIYIKGTIQSDGSFKLDNTSYTSFLTQTLPTTSDGFVYILLGQMYGTTSLRFFQYHAVYEYKNGKLRPYTNDDTSLASSGSGTSVHGINQVSHGLSVGNAIYLNEAYFKAKADTVITSDVLGIVTEVVTVDSFVYASSGVIPGSYTKGENYFLSNSVAGAVIPEPTYNLWDVRQFIGTGLDGGKLLLEIDLGHEIQSGTSGGTTIFPSVGIPVSGGTVWHPSIIGTANQLLRRNTENTSYEFFTPAYITGYTENDPVFGNHTAKNIADGTGFLKNNGTGTWSYINATYLTAETDPLFGSHTAKNIANGTGFLKNNGSGTWSYINEVYLTEEIDGSITNEIQDISGSGSDLSGYTISLSSDASPVVLPNEADPVFVTHTAKNIANGTGFLKNNGAGTWSYINATYLTAETDPVFDSHTAKNIANGTGFLKNNGSGTWSYDNSTFQINTVQNGTKTANWTHDATSGDIGAYRVNLAATTISIHNLSNGMQGTIFLNFVTTTPTALTVNTFSDAGTTGLTEIVIGAEVGFAINKSTSITYTCANDGTNTYVYLVYGKE